MNGSTDTARLLGSQTAGKIEQVERAGRYAHRSRMVRGQMDAVVDVFAQHDLGIPSDIARANRSKYASTSPRVCFSHFHAQLGSVVCTENVEEATYACKYGPHPRRSGFSGHIAAIRNDMRDVVVLEINRIAQPGGLSMKQKTHLFLRCAAIQQKRSNSSPISHIPFFGVLRSGAPDRGKEQRHAQSVI